MTKEEAIVAYNAKVGNILPGLSSVGVWTDGTFDTTAIAYIPMDIFSLTDVIDNSRTFSFKVSLFPYEESFSLFNFDSTDFSNSLLTLEGNLSEFFKQMGFYRKYNTSFETYMHVPIMDTSSLSASDEIKSVFQIPIEVIFYIYFNDKLTTINRYYNSNIYFDHTAYGLFPSSILDEYNQSDLFEQTTPETPYSDPTIFDYAIDFTYADNFTFIIDDIDILAQTKNIVFMEIKMNPTVKNIDFYIIAKDEDNVYVRKCSTSKLGYRKVYYNLDFINIRNEIVKYT